MLRSLLTTFLLLLIGAGGCATSGAGDAGPAAPARVRVERWSFDGQPGRRVVGKSGYINGVRTLSGFLKSKDGHYYAFSILMNRIPDDPTVKTIQEKIVRAVDNHATSLAAGQ